MWTLPQPWEAADRSREEHLRLAAEAEAQGARLVKMVLVDPYPDDGDRWGLWCVSETVVLDWRTGEHIITFEDDEELPDTSQWFLVERHAVELV